MFKKPVKIFCANDQELVNLLIWLRNNSGLSYVNYETWEIHAIIPSIFSEERTLKGFWVMVPHELAKPRIKTISEQEAFQSILSPPGTDTYLHFD